MTTIFRYLERSHENMAHSCHVYIAFQQKQYIFLLCDVDHFVEMMTATIINEDNAFYRQFYLFFNNLKKQQSSTNSVRFIERRSVSRTKKPIRATTMDISLHLMSLHIQHRALLRLSSMRCDSSPSKITKILHQYGILFVTSKSKKISKTYLRFSILV